MRATPLIPGIVHRREIMEMIADRRVRFSTLWLFATLNYLYADIVTLMDPTFLNQIMVGQVGSIEMTQGFLFGAAVLMETAIAMVLLSRVLGYRANRWANMIVGAIHTLAVAASVLLGDGVPAPYYLFFATIEVSCTLLIIGYAWKWKEGGDATSSAEA